MVTNTIKNLTVLVISNTALLYYGLQSAPLICMSHFICLLNVHLVSSQFMFITGSQIRLYAPPAMYVQFGYKHAFISSWLHDLRML